MSEPIADELEARIEAKVRRLHHYGDPPDKRLQEDVDADVADVLDDVRLLIAAARASAREEAARVAERHEMTSYNGEPAIDMNSPGYEIAQAIRALAPEPRQR